MQNAFRVRHQQPHPFSPNYPHYGPIAIIGANDSSRVSARAFDAKIVDSPDPAFRNAVMTSDGVIYGQKHGTRYKIGHRA